MPAGPSPDPLEGQLRFAAGTAGAADGTTALRGPGTAGALGQALSAAEAREEERPLPGSCRLQGDLVCSGSTRSTPLTHQA